MSPWHVVGLVLAILVAAYLVWALLGVCMSAILYEPVFAIVGRAFSDAADRMRAIATVTVMGGLASSIFLPGTAALVANSRTRATPNAAAAVERVIARALSVDSGQNRPAGPPTGTRRRR